MIRFAIGCFAFFLLAGDIRSQEKTGVIEESVLRKAAAKSLQVIQESQRVFYKKSGCVSCHHQILPVLAVSVAHTKEVGFDTEFAEEVAGRVFSYQKDFDAIIQGQYYIDDIDDGWKLVAAHAAGVPANYSTSAAAQFLAKSQRPDGSWYTIDRRPPQSYSRFTSTAVNARAVQMYLPDSFGEEKQRVLQAARQWLLKTPPQSTEERTFQLFGLLWTGADEDNRKKAAKMLLAEQREDGGWSQMSHLDSDAYSTGEALYALHRATGLAPTDPAYQRGLQFLLTTQLEDGSWRVESRMHPPAPVSPPYFNSGFPHGRYHQYASIAGTNWAGLALLLALPDQAGPKHEPLKSPSVAPAEKEGWIDIVLNGSAADLKKALDAGLNPNANTGQGTTALMMAVRDAGKVQLLLERGADVNARAKSGFTALMVASRYTGNAEVLRLLLKHGATVKAEEDVEVKFKASALFFAAATGDREMARLLLDAGARVEEPMHVLGMFQVSPLNAAIWRGDAPMMQYLLEKGANPNEVDEFQITSLGWATIGNQPGLVKTLLVRGAKVNHVDKLKMTPLLYAANADFGDTAVLEHLLAAGADRNAKDEEDRTALDLARLHRHAAAVKLLAGNAATP
jgi:ankyrin repeat protein